MNRSKKISHQLSVAVLSAITLSFAIALANAEDISQAPQNPSQTMEQSVTGSEGLTPPSVSGTQEKADQYVKSMTTCTDLSGKTFRKGDKGFEKCLKEKESQMGGKLGVESPMEESQDTTSNR
jgi:hypothetical protein